MDWQVIAVYVMLALTVVLFVTDKVRTDIVGLLIMVALGLLGILKPKQLLLGFGNEALVTIAAMFVLSAALMRSGLVAALSGKLADLSRGSPMRFMVLALGSVCFMSAFINNTPVVVVFIPAVLTVCATLGESPSKFLMPISFASMLGGSCTLIGTSSNILISSIAAEKLPKDMPHGIAMFEFAVVGVPIVLVGMGYLIFFSRRLLPNRTTIASTVSADEVKEYITQVRIGRESHLIGHKLAETPLADAGVRVAELIRGERIQRMGKEMTFEVDDILLIKGDLNKILELERKHEISITAEMKEGEDEVKRVEMTLFELMIAPESPLIGRTCRQIRLRQRFDISVFALQRRGRHHQQLDIADLELRMGDILLVRGTMDALENLRGRDEFILLEGVHDQVIERHKAPIALVTILIVVVLAALGLFPISVLALGGAGILVLTRVLTARDAYRAIDWPVLVLIAGMIALGTAMGTTGALNAAAEALYAILGGNDYVTLWVFYFMTAALSLLILNKPAAVLCAPLGIELAAQLGAHPKPFIMAVAFAASTAMATPMGYQTNLLVYGPGGYNYRDFVLFGMPLNIGVGILACLLIPLIWPL